MIEMKPELIIERINGYLDAFGNLNVACNRVSDYRLLALSNEHELIDSLHAYFLSISDKYPAKYWHPKLKIVEEDELIKVVHQWFFEAEFFKKIPELATQNVIAGFYELLEPFITTASIYKLDIAPPVWYGSLSDDFVIEGELGRFLLGFSCTD